MADATLVEHGCRRRDCYGIPCVQERHKQYVGFAGEVDTAEARNRTQRWNASHRHLCQAVRDTRLYIARVECIEAWFFPHIPPHTHALANVTVDALHDVSIDDELKDLEQRQKKGREQENRLKLIVASIWDYTMRLRTLDNTITRTLSNEFDNLP